MKEKKTKPAPEVEEEDVSGKLATIDEDNLDREWLQQPDLVQDYAEQHANAKRDLANAKVSLDLIEAETELSIRKNPEEFDIEKITESIVKAKVLTCHDFQKAQRVVINRQYNVDLLSAALSSLEHRKKSLENLTTLFMAGYFGSPKLPDDGG